MCLDRPHGSNTLQDGCVRRLEQKNGGDGCGSGSRWRWLPEPRAGGNGYLIQMENALDGAFKSFVLKLCAKIMEI